MDSSLVLRALLVGALPAIGLSGGAVARPATEKVLYSFGSGSDGAYPAAPLIKVGGKFYGTTSFGGSCFNGDGGCGTVFSFSMTAAGAETVLHDFSAGSDGASPLTALINFGGVFYGTTSSYGANGCPYCGTVFSITKTGVETVVYSFKAGDDGAAPQTSLINVGGTFYGATNGGGVNSHGTFFSVTPGGVETVLHSFGANGDGILPVGSLIKVGDNFYGVTYRGGASDNGTVFSVTKSGSEKVVYSFAAGDDAGEPEAGLIEVGGILYGTTYSGGGTMCPYQGPGCGTVFSVTAGGVETVLHRFGIKTNDGENPAASLINVDGKLYGTTYAGGAMGTGTVFSITTTGVEKVVYSFGNGTDGAGPVAALLRVGKAFYGTTKYGGTHGPGTIFELTP